MSGIASCVPSLSSAFVVGDIWWWWWGDTGLLFSFARTDKDTANTKGHVYLIGTICVEFPQTFFNEAVAP